MDQTLILIEDLNRTIGNMYKGTATVTFYTNESNATIWEIRGHKKELVVMLHYENGCKEANEIIDTEDTIFIKEEPRDDVNVCHQNESARDIQYMDNAEVVLHMTDTDNPCQPTKDYSLRSITCTSSEEAVCVQSTTFNDVSNEEAVSHSYTYIKSSVDTDLVADMNCIPDVPDSTSHLVKMENISQSTRCKCASTEEAIPILDMVCSISENVNGELGHFQNFKSESNHVIKDAIINYGQSCQSNCDTAPENNKNLDATNQIEFVCNSNDTNSTSQTENENIFVETQSGKLNNCSVLLRPLKKNKSKINNLSSVQEQGTLTSTGQVVTGEGNGSSVECSKCERRFVIKDNLGSLNQIQTTDNIHLCSCCVMTYNKFKYSMEKEKSICSGEKPFECPHCGKMFSSKYSLKQHNLIHTGVKPFECTRCNKKYISKKRLKVHEETHNGIKSYECSLCNKKFNRKGNLTQHMVIHSVVKPHECLQCNQKFYRKDQLIQHEVMHSEVKPFECSQCYKKFNLKAKLKLHEAIHSGVKPHECSQCNKKFNKKDTLKRHMLIHSVEDPHECSQCNKKFSRKDLLIQHEVIHSGMKPFECLQCNKKFYWKYQLIQHEAIHSGVKPFECSQCNMQFNWKYQLIQHDAIHSGVKSRVLTV